ncbi:MAG: hypothetical protein J7K88_07730 [Candidatus Fermentibacteraceae bacterium]|nr:hypothetical protein [Candidatus Fermentibacteraceae bacterium]
MKHTNSIKAALILTLLITQACGAGNEPPNEPQQQTVQQATHTADTTEAADTTADTDTTPEITTVDFSGEPVGGEPVSFVPAVGYWTTGMVEDNPALFLDGSRWEQGQTSANIAEQAREIYGDRYSEFLDNVQAYAYYPFAIARDTDNFTGGEISLRFKNTGGRIDQNAGILFDLKPNGDYYTLRASSLENNLVLWRVVRGNRSSIEWIRNTPTPTNQWHDLRLVVNGRDIQGYLDGQLLLEYTIEEPVDGKVGVWSKADSEVYFDDFTVTPEH